MRIVSLTVLLLISAAVSLYAQTASELEQAFHAPPHAAKPWVYWFWLDGNITKEGITADLEAMRSVGLGGALWMWGGGVGEGVRGPVKFVSPEWWELMRHTVREADRLGVKLNLTSGSGWSHSGGPWIKPEHSMRRLVAGERFRVSGPASWQVELGLKEPLAGVVAYPVDGGAMFEAGVALSASSAQPGLEVGKALDGDPATRWVSQGTAPGQGPTAARPESIVFSFAKPFEAAALFVRAFKDCGPRKCQLQASDDGKDYRAVCEFEMAPEEACRKAFDAVAARHFRLLITSAHPFRGQESWNVQIAEVRLLAKGEPEPSTEIQTASKGRAAVDLTDKVDAQGRLAWDAPAGTWDVRVFRHQSTGDRPHPILNDEGGWECDKLSPEAVEENWRGFVLRVLKECGPEARRVVGWTHIDSYEFGVQTWTPAFRSEFRQRCGYDPLPYLPAVLGQVVDSPQINERFLWDFRRIRADLFADGIGGRFRQLCAREGVALTTEPHLIPEVFDQLQYGGRVSEPVGNFLDERRLQWYAAHPPVGPEVHLAKAEASSAATYGLNGVVWAEAFTGTDHAHAWKESPGYLRAWGDLWLTEGINRFCFHCWAHSPSLTQRPGVTLGPWGIHFDRRNTWFDLATGYIEYLSRCQCLLQQGRTVADVCMLSGDAVTAEFPRHPELRAAGYDYHGLTTELLLQAKAVDGWIVLPSGMRYRLLTTYSRQMRPETIRKLRELVEGGVNVLGVKPDDAPGLVDYPASRVEVRRIADALWGSGPAADGKGRPCGRGRVFWGEPEKPAMSNSGCGIAAYLGCTREIEVLRAMGVQPDFEYARSGKEDCGAMLAYIHRKAGDADLYFVSNQAPRPRREECMFRVAARQPELWDAVTGEIRDLPVYRQQEGRTTIPLDFAAGQSFFVVFRKPAREQSVAKEATNWGALRTIADVAGPWQVAFDPKWGGPENPVEFAALDDWTQRPEAGIKHYSGKAVYRTRFDLPVGRQDRRLYLDLGRVKDLAEVRLNGKRLGVVWCDPWRIEITQAVRAGDNNLEIVVANEWVNRLIGDSGLPKEKRFTWTTWNPYKPDSPLLESGLRGPVTIRAAE